MPVVQEELGQRGGWLLWEITESEATLKQEAAACVGNWAEWEEITHAERRRAWLAARRAAVVLAEHMGVTPAPLYKDGFGKPRWPHDDWSVSLTHAGTYAAALMHYRQPSGIDLELIRPKLVPLAPKYLSAEEQQDACDDPTRLCVYWSAKEALYKLHGRRRLSFRTDLHITLPGDLHERGDFRGAYRHETQWEDLEMSYRRIGNYFLTFNAVE
ncbi:4'-phosphopantetheinyl transferase superfamily protein [Catalinimonas alkaloidigena]|uniref:4'-phosphopantetheinyl transferase superfamily protein n=2 Tax=Catalinimonas alkaloidigena TaxID=1075417 RepID=A0A1G8ZXR1_9BACT|nr:4'-phosphopantetheinyl transferase superfamily protein [Catalinimonas alkaloidigena]